MPKRAFVTGVTGQCGSFLAELLLKKGYEVTGLVRRLSTPNMEYIRPIAERLDLVDGDLMDQSSLNAAIKASQPDEVYNLAAQSFVATSFVQPVLTGEITGLGALRVLEAVRTQAPHARVYQASSSEMFGKVEQEPQNEATPMHPRSPYGIAKVYAYWASVNYREAYQIFASNGILFNMESERRGLEFVTRKISHGVAEIVAKRAKKLSLGNLDAKRDWGYAPEYVDLMWRILQHTEPTEFVAEAFRVAGIDDWEKHVVSEQKNFRPSEVYNLRGDSSKARKLLGWEPKVRFKELVKIMVEADLKRAGVA